MVERSSLAQMQAFFKSQEGLTNAARGGGIGVASGKILKKEKMYRPQG
jgi:hypothetical protein